MILGFSAKMFLLVQLCKTFLLHENDLCDDGGGGVAAVAVVEIGGGGAGVGEGTVDDGQQGRNHALKW